MYRFYCFPAWTTCRKAKAWLSEQGVEYEYMDILKNPPGSSELEELAKMGGMTVKELVNPKSAGFKKMGIAHDSLSDKQAAELIENNPKIMRRPLFTDGKRLAAGFSPDSFSDLLSS